MSDNKWTDEQRQIIFEVAMADEHGLTPHDGYLPAFEQLKERGILERRMVEGRAVYRTTAEFKARAGLLLHQAAAEQQAPLN